MAATSGVPQRRPTATEGQDRHGEGGDPPAHEPGAGTVVLRDLGRQSDVRHLEAAEGRRREHERDHHPRRGPGAAETHRHGEHQGEQHRHRQRAQQHEAAAATRASLLGVRPCADDRRDRDVPQLGQQHHQAGGEGGDAEQVGEVVREQQTRQGAETTGAHGAERVAQHRAAAQLRGLGVTRHSVPARDRGRRDYSAMLGFSSSTRLSSPLTNDGESSVDRLLASSTASDTATASGTSSL